MRAVGEGEGGGSRWYFESRLARRPGAVGEARCKGAGVEKNWGRRSVGSVNVGCRADRRGGNGMP